VDNISRIPRHRAIVRYYCSFRFRDYAVVVMESCDGSLAEFFQRYGDLTGEWQRVIRWKILEQIASGLQVCHSLNLMHRDIKPENSKFPATIPAHMLVLYTRIPNTDEFRFKLGDFGIARPALTPGQVATINPGDPRYRAPEVEESGFNGVYGPAIDIYSLGRLMGDIWAPENSKWRELQYQMTQQDPSKRPSASEIRDIAQDALNGHLD
jgi:serine/threonine protein kinase